MIDPNTKELIESPPSPYEFLKFRSQHDYAEFIKDWKQKKYFKKCSNLYSQNYNLTGYFEPRCKEKSFELIPRDEEPGRFWLHGCPRNCQYYKSEKADKSYKFLRKSLIRILYPIAIILSGFMKLDKYVQMTILIGFFSLILIHILGKPIGANLLQSFIEYFKL